jgi:hypothetical protein
LDQHVHANGNIVSPQSAWLQEAVFFTLQHKVFCPLKVDFIS